MSLTVFENYLRYVDSVLASTRHLLLDLDLLELESVLVTQGVVILYARMEQCFQQALECKCNRCLDAEVRAFALSVKKDKAGKLSLAAIKETFNRFSIDHRQTFTPLLNALNISTSWDSIVDVRQNIAHRGQRANFSLLDLKEYYDDIRAVLGCLCKALSLTDLDAKSICTLITFPHKDLVP